MNYHKLLLTTSQIYEHIHTRYGLTKTHFNFLVVMSGMTPAQSNLFLKQYFNFADTSIRQYFHILSKSKLIVNKGKEAKERGVYSLTMKAKKILKEIDIYTHQRLKDIL